MDKLPLELMLKILSHIDHWKDVLSFRNTCLRFRKIYHNKAEEIFDQIKISHMYVKYDDVFQIHKVSVKYYKSPHEHLIKIPDITFLRELPFNEKINIDTFRELPWDQQDERLCLDAIANCNCTFFGNYGCIFDHIYDKNEKMCLIGLEHNPHNLKYIKNQTLEMCMDSVRKDGLALKYVHDVHKNDELCKIAVKNNGTALQYVKNKNDELCSIAVKNCARALEFVDNQTEDMCIDAIYRCKCRDRYSSMHIRCVFQFVNNKSAQICEWALIHNAHNITTIQKCAKNLDPDVNLNYLCKYAVRVDAHVINFIEEQTQTDDVCLFAVKKDGLLLRFVKKQTHDICLEAIKQNPHSLEYVSEQTIDICFEAITRNKQTIKYIKDTNIKYFLYVMIGLSTALALYDSENAKK